MTNYIESIMKKRTSIPVCATHIPDTPPQTNRNANVKVNITEFPWQKHYLQ